MLTTVNDFILRHVRHFELAGVLMRIGSFSVVSWMESDSPFLLVWIANATDAVLLSWCAVLKRDRAYIVLNVFWVLISVLGVVKAGGWIH